VISFTCILPTARGFYFGVAFTYVRLQALAGGQGLPDQLWSSTEVGGHLTFFFKVSQGAGNTWWSNSSAPSHRLLVK